MPTYQKAPAEAVKTMAEVLCKFESHKPLIEAKVTIDLLFAYCDRDDDTGKPKNAALMLNGYPCLGVARIVNLKDRVKGLADAEICIDGDWWTEKAQEGQKVALLDHELYHIALKTRKELLQFDDHGRPKLRMRKHDIQVGWFAVVAERNGADSMEQTQAKAIMENLGQFFWSALVPDGSPKQLVTQ